MSEPDNPILTDFTYFFFQFLGSIVEVPFLGLVHGSDVLEHLLPVHPIQLRLLSWRLSHGARGRTRQIQEISMIFLVSLSDWNQLIYNFLSCLR